MADLAEVETAIVSTIAAALYPTGTSNPSAISAPIRIYRGWPNAVALDADLLAGTVNVSVFSESGMTRNVTRYLLDAFQTAIVAPTVTATLAARAVTIAITIAAPGNVVGVQFGAGAMAAAYAYLIQPGDTAATVAAALAAKVPGATVAGAVITLPSGLDAAAVAMVPQPVATEVRRQEQSIRVSCWCSSPDQRDATAGLIDNALASLRTAGGAFTQFLQVKPGEMARVVYQRSYTGDAPTKDALWRRDLVYSVEYGTSYLELDPVMLFGAGTINAG
jgi:hypothetical protein